MQPFNATPVLTALTQEFAVRPPDCAVPRDELAQSLCTYLSELYKWNKAYNLTAVREPQAMVAKHLFDSLSVLPFIQGERVADVGTGAGLPGIPLALCLPATQFRLIDSNGKKIRFVSHVCRKLGLSNVTAEHARVESLAPDECFDAIVSRAFSSLVDFARGCDGMLAADGTLVAMKGRYPKDEIDALPAHWQVQDCQRVDVSGLDAERHILRIRRAQ